MTPRLLAILIVLAGVMGADGVILAAASAHRPTPRGSVPASSMLLFHAAAVLGGVRWPSAAWCIRCPARDRGRVRLRRRRRAVRRRPDAAAFAGHGLFPMAAPTGGTLLIASWLRCSARGRAL